MALSRNHYIYSLLLDPTPTPPQRMKTWHEMGSTGSEDNSTGGVPNGQRENSIVRVSGMTSYVRTCWEKTGFFVLPVLRDLSFLFYITVSCLATSSIPGCQAQQMLSVLIKRENHKPLLICFCREQRTEVQFINFQGHRSEISSLFFDFVFKPSSLVSSSQVLLLTGRTWWRGS